MKNSKTGGFFPLFVDIHQKACVVIGAGRIAARRVRTLADFCENITVIAPEAAEAIKDMAASGQITWKQKPYERDDLYGAELVLAATDNPRLNDEIYSVCRCLGILVNVCSDQTKCDFQFPGIIRQNEIVIGVNGAGKDHAAVRRMREKIESMLSGGDADE